jgi:hypothetical protein
MLALFTEPFDNLAASPKVNISVTVLKTMAAVSDHISWHCCISDMDHVIHLYLCSHWSQGIEAVTGTRVNAPARQRANASTVSGYPGVLKLTQTLTLSLISNILTSNKVKETITLQDQPSDNPCRAKLHPYLRETLQQSTWVLGVTAGLCGTRKSSKSLTSATGLFQSDHDFDIVSELSHDAGLTQMEEGAQAAAKAASKDDKAINSIYYSIYYSIYAQSCSNPELVREHLDSGALVYLIAGKEAAMLAIPSKKQEMEHDFRDPCYVYVLLGACAMTLGCQIPDQYIAMLKKVYTEAGLMPDALKHMKKALKGPHGYKHGEPYDFESEDLIETANAMDDTNKESIGLRFIGMNILSPGGLFDTGMGNSSTSAIHQGTAQEAEGPKRVQAAVPTLDPPAKSC